MATKNDITGDSIQTRGVSNAYRDNYDLIWGKKKKENGSESKEQEQTKDNKGQSSDSNNVA